MPGGYSHTRPESLAHISESMSPLGPWWCLALAVIATLLAEAFWGKRYPKIGAVVALLGFLISIIWTFAVFNHPPQVVFFGMAAVTHMGRFFLLLVDFLGILTVAVSLYSNRLREGSPSLGEYWILLMSLATGVGFMLVSRNLLFMYVSLEMASIPSYLLAGYSRFQRKPAEASLKYIIYGAFASGIMLYGISWVYGLTGTLDITSPEMAHGFSTLKPWSSVFLMSLLLSGLMFKVGAAPLHFWAPDVYTGAPYPIVAFFAVAPKTAGMVMLMVLGKYLHAESFQWVVAVVAGMSMLWGTLAALGQKNFKRLLAYSGVAQAGYILVGIIPLSSEGFGASAFFLTISFGTTFGAFVAAGWLSEQTGSDGIEDYRGMAGALPLLTVCLTLFLVGMAGLPPTGGFTAKFQVLVALLSGWKGFPSLLLAFIFILTTVASIYYYLMIPARMIFKPAANNSSFGFHIWVGIILVILAIPVFLLGIWGFDHLQEWLANSNPI